ncbi:hypothetical protein A9Q84_06600 [Halobacteriovorax marinus]|uniref:Outer membrane protein beta-barrel domain-containing protein n=1 Tax=Halobacteriovorax marinus TaxID=97084 RepID=A0A1Y5FF52_9BACT|nr:hypothetical protein A9Q84_06600 [Halobacteriovorax marinus]
MTFKNLSLVLLSFLISFQCLAQAGVSDGFSAEEEDLNIGGDIFSDFNEDIESNQVMEDERFFRYGRFFTFSFSLGITTFSGNRGIVTENAIPSYGLQLTVFRDFQTAISMGIGFSRHTMYFDQTTLEGFNGEAPGLVQVGQLRVYVGYKYYMDTANLGTAITYSNPYLTGRLEYWYTTNKFIDNENIGNRSGGGLGVGLGGGLEFPIKLKESYLGVEILYHNVNFHDKNTGSFQPVVDDLGGDAYTTMVSYIWNW